MLLHGHSPNGQASLDGQVYLHGRQASRVRLSSDRQDLSGCGVVYGFQHHLLRPEQFARPGRNVCQFAFGPSAATSARSFSISSLSWRFITYTDLQSLPLRQMRNSTILAMYDAVDGLKRWGEDI